ncbi:peptidylprolyl isomerase [Acidocella aromatica]|uniref:Parvulin-like PPIase n=1 Tax=Acidocella aromatica TaxID=1303579 RepID=A0A840VDN8_9PROT|nr:peptidylprolyl isomerase [Acidocella aromatica]MBB5373978.1 peptidyl-prolyl cis-trans isomerase C [Acidocella aromatica]
MRRHTLRSVLTAATLLAAPAAFAQSSASSSAPAAAPANANPVVAIVNGTKIYMSDIQADAQTAPAQVQQLPPDQLFPLLVNQEVDRKALLVAAQKEGLQNNPDVAKAMQDAANIRLENAFVQQKVAPQVSDTAVQAAYNQQYAGKPGPEQVEARHILVQTQAQAQDIINQLNKGADFAKLAEKYSIDPGAKNGGELGWFSKDEMVPSFANAAFALKTGQYTKTPVQTQFGWHVILCEGKRTAPTPALADVQDQIKQKLANQAVQKVLDDARSQVQIQLFNADGTPMKAATPAQGGSSN